MRLFAAVYPPIELARTLLGAAQGQLDGIEADARLTDERQVHLTLQFIGETSAGALESVRESVARAAAGLHETALVPQELISLPERGPARLLALETDAPPILLEVKRRLATRFARSPRARPADRFLPHLTLCRFRAPVRMPRLRRAVALPAFPVREIRLMRSTLHPSGARHDEIAHFTLAANPDGTGGVEP